MTSSNDKVINVYLDCHHLKDILFLGVLSIAQNRGKELFTFEFAKDAIDCDSIRTYLPDVQVGEGHFYLSDENTGGLYKLLMDSAPDRWGRVLLKKKSLLNAKKAMKNTQKMLFESDYLLSIADVSRMGALRFQDPNSEEFLSANENAIPPITEIRTLENICKKIENDDEVDEWLEQLIAPGTSLGGARPKANIVNTNGVLYIAKFPSNKDDSDTGLWEYLTNRLAKKAAINVPDCEPVKLNSDYTTLLIERFDRTAGNRLHFVSAMALTQHNDGDEDASYLEIVEFIKRYGRDAKTNLQQLWRRIVFNIAISNGDDHLRNHGFLLENDGWGSLKPTT